MLCFLLVCLHRPSTARPTCSGTVAAVFVGAARNGSLVAGGAGVGECGKGRVSLCLWRVYLQIQRTGAVRQKASTPCEYEAHGREVRGSSLRQISNGRQYREQHCVNCYNHRWFDPAPTESPRNKQLLWTETETLPDTRANNGLQAERLAACRVAAAYPGRARKALTMLGAERWQRSQASAS